MGSSCWSPGLGHFTAILFRLNSDAPFGRLRLKRLVLYGLIAIGAVTASASYGDLHSHNDAKKAVGIGAATLFVLVGSAAVHRLAAESSRVVQARTGGPAAATVEVTVSAAGYIFVAVVALDLFQVSVQNLLLGGAITGVVLGIALQQILGNVFAGVALLHRIVLRSVVYGGEVAGTVRSVNLTYVTLQSDNGVLHVPNSGVLASAINTGAVPEKTSDDRAEGTRL
ncbi:MAG: mechanosensitive ion channel [Actinobacteria bacterium]|nr:MAG: mechanosensitive ion channel [Actinomycetota bacterium]